MAPPRYSLSLSRVASRLLDNPRDLSWLMPGWFLRGGNEERFSNVHKLYRTKPRNGRRAAKSKARSRNEWRVETLAEMAVEMKMTCWARFFYLFEEISYIESVDTISSSKLLSSRNISTLRVKWFWKLINFIVFYKILRILAWRVNSRERKRYVYLDKF